MMVVWLTMYMVQNPSKYDDVICEQPLMLFVDNIFGQASVYLKQTKITKLTY